MKKYDYKTFISFILNFLDISLLVSTDYCSNFLVIIFVLINGVDYWSLNKKIDYFIKMMKSLVFLIWTL